MKKMKYVGIAFALMLALVANAKATTINAVSVYIDPIVHPYDIFTIANTSDPGYKITQVVIDLSTSAGGVFFDPTASAPGVPAVFPFTPDVASAAATGYTSVVGDSDGSQLLTLSFVDFDPGELFLFHIDVDAGTPLAPAIPNVVKGIDFAGSTFSATFSNGGGPTTLSGTYASFLPNGAKADLDPIPEPGTVLLFATGLVGLVGMRRKQLLQLFR